MKTNKLLAVVLLIGITLVASAPGGASNLTQAKLEKFANDYLLAHRDSEHVSSLGVTVLRPGQPALAAYVGTSEFDGGSTVDENNLFQIGSITKSFITAIVLQLESDPTYHFSIDDSITTFLPQYSKWHGITVRQLMNMTSGIYTYNADDDFIKNLVAYPERDFTPEELIGYSYQHSLIFAPGSKWDYCNSNYILLGMLIEKLTGHTLDEEIKARIILPFHLMHTYYMPFKPDAAFMQRMAHGYYYRFNEDTFKRGLDVTSHSLSWGGAAGAIISNASDTAQWVRVLFTPGMMLNAEQLVKLKKGVSLKSGQSIGVPTADDPDIFALGIVYSYLPKYKLYIYRYEGMTQGYRSFYIFDETRNEIISATINSGVDKVDDLSEELIMKIYQYMHS